LAGMHEFAPGLSRSNLVLGLNRGRELFFCSVAMGRLGRWRCDLFYCASSGATACSVCVGIVFVIMCDVVLS
jgi:hypothetical protein